MMIVGESRRRALIDTMAPAAFGLASAPFFAADCSLYASLAQRSMAQKKGQDAENKGSKDDVGRGQPAANQAAMCTA